MSHQDGNAEKLTPSEFEDKSERLGEELLEILAAHHNGETAPNDEGEDTHDVQAIAAQAAANDNKEKKRAEASISYFPTAAAQADLQKAMPMNVAKGAGIESTEKDKKSAETKEPTELTDSSGSAAAVSPPPSLARGRAGSGQGPGAYALAPVDGAPNLFRSSVEPDRPPHNLVAETSGHQDGSPMLEATAVDDIVEAQAKPIEWWTPRKIGFGVVGTLVVLGIIVAVSTTVVVKNQNNSDNEETPAPTLPPMERLAAIEEVLLTEAYSNEDVNASAALRDPQTPQYQALQWLALNDSHYVPIEDVDHLIQRYALGVLYFATGGPENWLESFEFLQPEHECSWSGALLCEGGANSEFVTGIQLQGNGLMGRLPGTELGFLSQLNLLALGSNNLMGRLPPMLPQLTQLVLAKNAFTGTIPDEWTKMTQLGHLHIQMNDLNGTIPNAFGALNKLTSLDIEGNYLTGHIPDSMWDLTNMENFIIESQKKLSGTISPLVGRWKNVSVFLINMNNNITGSIPSQVGLLTNLVEFKTAQSHMRGPIPSEMGLLTNMKFLALSRNGYQGTVPTEIARLTNLHQMYLQTTWLTGDMHYFCQAYDAGKFPRLTTLIADKGELNCTCCTCCDY